MPTQISVAVEMASRIEVDLGYKEALQVAVDATQGLPGPAGDSHVPVYRSVEELDAVEGSGFGLLDVEDPGTVLGTLPGLIDDGPLPVTTISLMDGAQVIQLVTLNQAQAMRVRVGGNWQPWASMPLGLPSLSTDYMIIGTPSGHTTVRAATTPIADTIVRRSGTQIAAGEPSIPTHVATKRYVDNATGLVGSGRPTVRADKGVLYRDTDATNGAMLWINTRGTSGANSWAVLSGDTGRRRLTPDNPASMPAGEISGDLWIQRVNNTVTLQAINLASTTDEDCSPYLLPVGIVNFIGPQAIMQGLSPVGDPTEGAVIPISAASAQGGNRIRIQLKAGIPLSGVVSWEVSPTSWPVTLPGTP